MEIKSYGLMILRPFALTKEVFDKYRDQIYGVGQLQDSDAFAMLFKNVEDRNKAYKEINEGIENPENSIVALLMQPLLVDSKYINGKK